MYIAKLLFVIVIFCAFPVRSIMAEQAYDFDQFNRVLQSEYQSQLQQNKVKKISTPIRPVPPTQRKAITRTQPSAKKVAPRRVIPPARRIAPHRVAPQAHRRAPPQPVHRNPVHQGAAALPPNDRIFFQAASSGNINLIAKQLKQGININVSNAYRETALHMAAAKGQYSTVIYLINHGASIYARTAKNWLPLHHAVRFRHAVIANYLKMRGVSPYQKTTDGLNAIDMARNNKDQRMINILSKR